MRFHAYFPVLTVCVVLIGADPAMAGGKSPPPSNTKLSAEENTKVIESTKIDQYYDVYKRQDGFLEANASFRKALDDRRTGYAAPMAEARGKNIVEERAGVAASPDITPVSDSASDLSEAGIRAFYAESATIHHKPLEVYKEWTKNHLHKEVKFTETTTIKLPGASPVVNSRTMTRNEMLKELDENYKSMRGVTVKNEVTSVTVAPNGKSAEVKDKSVITGVSVPVGDGKDLRGDGTSTCNDKVVFTPGAGIQVLSSVCTLDITLSSSQDL